MFCVRVAFVPIPPQYLPHALCRRDDVDPDWWVEPDLEELTAETYWPRMQETKHNMMRAKLLCYSCPIVDICRQEAWDEPAGVWAALDGGDRFTARKTGAVQFGDHRKEKGSESTRPLIASMFRDGVGVSEIAATLKQTEVHVWRQIRASLMVVREKEEPWLHEISEPPSLPPGRQTRTGFRFGLVMSSELEASEPMEESA